MNKLLWIALGLCGCGVSVGPAGSWMPADQVAPPFAIERGGNPTPGPLRSGTLAGGAVRLVTYNIDEEEPGVLPEAIAAAISGDPDLARATVFLIQEAEAYPGEPSSRIQLIADTLGLGYVYVPGSTTHTSDHTDGLAIMSVYPIENVMKMDLPDTGYRHRIAVSADLAIGDRVLHVIDVHLELHANAATRVAQLRPAVIDAEPVTLVVGDFNMSWMQWVGGVPVLSGTSASDQSKAVDSYMAALGFAAPTRDSGPTVSAYGLSARVDAVFARGLEVTFGGVPRVGPSDHWPMWVDVQLP